MGSKTLSGIVEVENEIQQQVDAEEKQWQKWLEDLRRDLEDEAVQEEERLKQELDADIAGARKEAEKEAEQIRAEAAKWVERIGSLSDEELRELVMRHLAEIVTGADSDRQDVQG